MFWNPASIISLVFLCAALFSLLHLKKKNTTLLKQNKLLGMMDRFPGMVFRCQNDAPLTLLFISQGGHSLTGHKPSTLIRKQVGYLSLIHSEDLKILQTQVRDALETKTALSQQHRIMTLTGQNKWVQTEGMWVYDKQEQPLFFEGMTRDISEQKQKETRNKILENIAAACLRASYNEDLLEEVLRLVLEGLGADQAWLIQTTHLEGEDYQIVKVVSRAHLPTNNARAPIPLNPARCQQVLASEGILKCDLKTAWPREDPHGSGEQSIMCTAIKTKIGKPWIFGIHYCNASHLYSEDEDSLFSEIAAQLPHTLYILRTIKKLSKSDYILTEAQRIAHIGIWNLDIIDNCLTWSDEIYRIFGLQPKQLEATYEGFLKLIHPDDRARVDQAYTQSVIDKIPYNITHRLLLADGTIKYVNEQCETFYDDTEKAVRSFGIVQDITHQKKIEAKLRQSLIAVNNTEDAVAVMNDKHEIIEINAAYSKITGYSRKEVLGKKPDLLKSGKHTESFYELQVHDLRDKGLWKGEVWKRRKNGELFPTWSIITTLRGPTQKIVNYVSVFSDVSPLKSSQKNRNFFGHHDPLTKLPNQILFNDRLEHALQHGQREEKKLAVILLDLDYFRKINERLGYAVGDGVLRQVARRIKKSMRDEDTVAHLEGDQFVILVEKMRQAQDVVFLVKKLKAIFEEAFIINKHEMHLNISVGISFYPEDATDGDGLMETAKTAMIRAKEAGRNKFQFSTPSLSLATFEHLSFEKALSQALKENELVLHYQAQYTLKTNQVTTAEALVRWNHPEFGLLFPDKFIPFAEESGLIQEIEQWILETACAQMANWIKQGQGLKRVAVNISGVQFQRSDIVSLILHALKKTGLAAERLELEITETAIMKRIAHSIDVLDQLSRKGIHITIDDFGTGYSSLSHLSRLPIHRLKIEQSFVQDLPKKNESIRVIRAIKTLAHSLQIGVIAGGVETKAQHQFLQSLGCDEAQGYHYHRPVLEDPSASFLNFR